MEGLTRLVSESMARHGFDRPLDYRRLHWSRWFRCESHHSLLFVPSKPGVFALAEEIMDLDRASVASNAHVGTAASAVPRSGASGAIPHAESRNPEAEPRRMLAVTQFFEDDDMAFVLDRMLSSQNPMRARLISGRYFVRFVVIEDQPQRRTICNALNQWMVSTAEKATGIGPHFATSLELTPATEYVPADAQQPLFASATGVRVGTDAFVRPPERSSAEVVWDRVSDPVGPSAARQDFAATADAHVATAASPALSAVEGAVPRSEASGSGTELGFSALASSQTAPQPDSGAATDIHRSNPFPSGF